MSSQAAGFTHPCDGGGWDAGVPVGLVPAGGGEATAPGGGDATGPVVEAGGGEVTVAGGGELTATGGGEHPQVVSMGSVTVFCWYAANWSVAPVTFRFTEPAIVSVVATWLSECSLPHPWNRKDSGLAATEAVASAEESTANGYMQVAQPAQALTTSRTGFRV
jgi:hypothetical protein